MSQITSSQLQQILDINAKAIEIYIETSNNYESIIKLLEEIKEKDCEHIAHNTKYVEKIDEQIKKLEDMKKKDQETIKANHEVLKESIAKLEKTVFKVGVVLSSSAVLAVIAVIVKLLGIHLP